MSQFPVIAVVGSGAVGGYYGAKLAKAGHDVHFLMRGDYETVAREGLRVRSCDGDFALSPQTIHVYDDSRRMPKADLVIVALKSTAPNAGDLVEPLVKDNTAILTLQNGLGNEERLAERFGPTRILGGLAFVCINRIAPGVIHHMEHGLVRLGEFTGGDSPRARAIVERFVASGVKCEVLDSLLYGRWLKLVWNIPFNGLGAALDLTTDRLVGSEAGLSIVRRLMEEVIEAALAHGLTFRPDLIEHQIALTREMGAYRTSMQIDREESRPMEVEAIFAEPLRRARERGVAAPTLQSLLDLLRVVDAASTAAR